MEARIEQLADDGVDRELAFPNAVLALLHFPDKALRESVLPRLQRVHRRASGAGQRTLLRGRPDQLVGRRGRPRTLTELKSLGLKTFLMPLNPGKDDDGKSIDYGSTAMNGVWDAIEESGVPSPTTSARPG